MGDLDTLSYVSLGVMGGITPVFTASVSPLATLAPYKHIPLHACTQENNIYKRIYLKLYKRD